MSNISIIVRNALFITSNLKGECSAMCRRREET
jgi:hypothetical protein